MTDSPLATVAIEATDQTLVHAIMVLSHFMPSETYWAAYRALVVEHARRKQGAAPLLIEMAGSTFNDLPEDVRAILAQR